MSNLHQIVSPDCYDDVATNSVLSDTHNDEQSTARNATRMSVKDRIRAMNLDAASGSTSLTATTNSTTSSSSFRNNILGGPKLIPPSNSSRGPKIQNKLGRVSPVINDLPQKIMHADSDNHIEHVPDHNSKELGRNEISQNYSEIDGSSATIAITSWRKKRRDAPSAISEKKLLDGKEDITNSRDTEEDSENWTLSDLIKDRAVTKKVMKQDVSHDSTAQDKDQDQTTKLKSIGVSNQINSLNGTYENDGPSTFVIPKLRPVRRTSPRPESPILNASLGPKTNSNADRLNVSPTSPVSPSTFKIPQLRPVRKNTSILENSTQDTLGSSQHHQSQDVAIGQSTFPMPQLKSVGRHSFDGNPDELVHNRVISLNPLVPKEMSKHSSRVESNYSKSQAKMLNQVNEISHTDHARDVNKSINLNNAVATSPSRTNISDRIKAFNSPTKKLGRNGWKHSAPATSSSTIPPSIPSNSIHKRPPISTGSAEDESSTVSCDVSDRGAMNNVDDDSVSVATPVGALITPARLGAQPPTPCSNSSDAAYTAASSGDGAVAGSNHSYQSRKQQQNMYEHFDTPDVSVQDENSTCASSINDDKNVKKFSAKEFKNSLLQSKLEGDKEKEVRKQQKSLIASKKLKVPALLMETQRKVREDILGKERARLQWDNGNLIIGQGVQKTDTCHKMSNSKIIPETESDEISIKSDKDAIQSEDSSPNILIVESTFVSNDTERNAIHDLPGTGHNMPESVHDLPCSTPKDRSDASVYQKSDTRNTIKISPNTNRSIEVIARNLSKTESEKKTCQNEDDSKLKTNEDDKGNSNKATTKAPLRSEAMKKIMNRRRRRKVAQTTKHTSENGKTDEITNNKNNETETCLLPPIISRSSLNESQEINVKHENKESNNASIETKHIYSSAGSRKAPVLLQQTSLNHLSEIEEEYPMDEGPLSQYPIDDDEPEPDVGEIYSDAEDDDLLDHNITMALDLSPIKESDTSKHNVRLMTPDRDLREMQSESTPKTANRHIIAQNRSSNNNDSQISDYTIKSDAISNSSTSLSAPILTHALDEIMSSRFNAQRIHSSERNSGVKTDSSTNVSKSDTLIQSNIAKIKKPRSQISDANSDVSSDVFSCSNFSLASSASGGVTMTSSRANRVLLGRRGKRSMKNEPIHEKNLAANLAKKMLHGGMPEIKEKSGFTSEHEVFNHDNSIEEDNGVTSSLALDSLNHSVKNSKAHDFNIKNDDKQSILLESLHHEDPTPDDEAKQDISSVYTDYITQDIYENDLNHSHESSTSHDSKYNGDENLNSFVSSIDHYTALDEATQKKIWESIQKKSSAMNSSYFSQNYPESMASESELHSTDIIDNSISRDESYHDFLTHPPDVMSWLNQMDIQKFASDVKGKIDEAHSVVSSATGVISNFGYGSTGSQEKLGKSEDSEILNKKSDLSHTDIACENDAAIEVEYISNFDENSPSSVISRVSGELNEESKSSTHAQVSKPLVSGVERNVPFSRYNRKY